MDTFLVIITIADEAELTKTIPTYPRFITGKLNRNVGLACGNGGCNARCRERYCAGSTDPDIEWERSVIQEDTLINWRRQAALRQRATRLS